MKPKFWFVSLFTLLLICSGCASSPPAMPNYQTAQEKACARDCQHDYNMCMNARDPGCNDVLGQCYKACQNP